MYGLGAQGEFGIKWSMDGFISIRGAIIVTITVIKESTITIQIECTFVIQDDVEFVR